jgi:acyl-CoA thioesterase I
MSNRRTAQRGWCVCLTAGMIVFTGLAAACGADNATPTPQGLGPDGDNSTSIVHQRSNATVKIMPLGDSITESNTGQFSYRYYLWHLLLAKGYHTDFVGSRHGVGNGPPANPDFDMDHEGHAGWRADEILAQIRVWAILFCSTLGTMISAEGRASPARSVTLGASSTY